MKTVSVADLRNKFADISTRLRNGEKLTVTMRGRPFATLSPASKGGGKKLEWPDRAAWRAKVFSKKPRGRQAGDVLEYDRGDT